MSLRKRPLGRSGLEITTVGFGAWAVGGGGYAFGWGPQDDRQSVAAMHHALELGINWIDTAAIYGNGHSEEVVGRFLAETPAADRPLVFTKCGMVWDPHDPVKFPTKTLEPASIRRECEASLERLGIEHIDLYQFHWPDVVGTPVEDSWETMVRLIEEGKVRCGGVSNFDVPLLERCEAIRHVDSLQPPFAAIRRDVAAAEIPWCAQQGTGIIVYSPMASGMLTDSFSAERVAAMADDDWRKDDARFNSPQLEKNLAFRDSLRPIAQRHDVSVAAIAVAWTIAWPDVTAAIVGARSPQQVDGWVAAANLELSPGDLDEIAANIERYGVGSGPVKP